MVKGGEIPRVSRTALTVETWGLMRDHAVDCWLVLSYSYIFIGPELAFQAKSYARVSYKIWVGEDETFDKSFAGGYAI